jgi:hypothetical protein
MMGNWSMKTDRELLILAREKRTTEQIAQKLKKSVPAVLKAARRLGLNLVERPIRSPKAKN